MYVISANDNSAGEEEAKFDDKRAQEIFDEWMVSLQLDQCWMLAILMENFKKWQQMNVKDNTREAGANTCREICFLRFCRTVTTNY